MVKKKPKSKVSKHPAILQNANEELLDVMTAALSKAPLPVLMKVCRLCETKDGPFLNIFDAEKVTAKKIEELMPFGIAENDDLPHKICFRCSAKVEELHEFIQKCIKTQENLRSAMGKQGPLSMKSRTRVRWEHQLHKTKLTNDDICDVLIKRAMEGIPLHAPFDEIVEEKSTPDTRKPLVNQVVPRDSSSESESDDEDAEVSLKQVKLNIAKPVEEPPVTRTSRSAKSNDLVEELKPLNKSKKTKTYARKVQNKVPDVEAKPPETQKLKIVPPEVEKEAVIEKPKETPPPPLKESPPFNIMDHVYTIKVNGVGYLFQCKLCIKNFLRKDIVLNHGCAKNNAPPKETNSTNAAVPEPPKPSTVKYIKMDKDPKRPLSLLVDKTVERLIPVDPVQPEVKPKPKPKIGPASKIRPKPEPAKEIPKEPSPPPKQIVPSPATHSVRFPTVPSPNSCYKLVPGPNNTFQLVAEQLAEKPVEEKPKPKSKASKRKFEPNPMSKSSSSKQQDMEKSSSPEVIDLDENNESQKPEPYPVGLFQPVPHHSSVYPPSHSPVPFTTPAMKKQSYTIVQTGNPSKLLISTKPQPVPEEPLKKKSKKKAEGKDKEPYSAVQEDNTTSKDPGFFTFVSRDPFLQPSYVLPTDNIIQESQISTSTPGSKPAVEKEKDRYPCNMCGESFSREKKLLGHIQSHYNQMDEEDEQRSRKPGPKRRTRKTSP